eukprot:CAMPEP_0175063302 /NCGR_PEP_ID=MMETSP0052_2-20121109/14676_1 /TAXON_ID=51329 ORGANISM="Polytomella parva, Strain SAG 63-3" /NCGR_SAMPLE_ID=MMETSP0052_2 /ASSEMBLY_ACC=CAM_ASM_000194 /LENGTH=108 /DNA_ID=CAMNT_0016329475 /DNA_START=418 /DNA_END=744 /DNA_ORIENTATION=+
MTRKPSIHISTEIPIKTTTPMVEANGSSQFIKAKIRSIHTATRSKKFCTVMTKESSWSYCCRTFSRGVEGTREATAGPAAEGIGEGDLEGDGGGSLRGEEGGGLFCCG